MTLSVMPIKDANKMGGTYNIDHYTSTGYLLPKRERTLARAREAYEAAWAESQKIHETNLEAIENNKRIRELVISTMKALGIPERWTEYEYKTSRSRNRTPVGKTAGFLSDLEKHVPISDGFEKAKETYDRVMKNCSKYEQETVKLETERVRKEEAEKARKLAERRSNRALVAILERYGLPDDMEWGDVLDHLLAQDKYLDLAHAMQATRGEWSDGFYRVEYALDRFKIVSEEDAEIYNSLSDLVNGGESDGRIFRDCGWNYGVLFGVVKNEQLLKDYHTTVEYTS